MPRPTGWSILAKEALELGVLALAAWVTEPESASAAQVPHLPAIPDETALAVEPAAPLAVEPDAPLMVEPEAPLAIDEASMPRDEFLKAIADVNTRYYRAYDGEGEMEVAFYDDGRMRMADEQHRFAGMVQNGHAHMLQIGTDDWTEVFVRTTPDGVLQLELRDGPHDGRVLTCEADNLRMMAER